MKISSSLSWALPIWIITCFIFYPVTLILQYTAVEILQLRLHFAEPPSAVLHLHPDIARPPHHKYIHRGSWRHFISNNSKPIRSFCSIGHHSQSQRSSAWTVDRSALAYPARLASAEPTISLSFGFFNSRSLTNKGPLLNDLITDRKYDFFCLTETWQQPNDFSQLNLTAPPGFV